MNERTRGVDVAVAYMCVFHLYHAVRSIVRKKKKSRVHISILTCAVCRMCACVCAFFFLMSFFQCLTFPPRCFGNSRKNDFSPLLKPARVTQPPFFLFCISFLPDEWRGSKKKKKSASFPLCVLLPLYTFHAFPIFSLARFVLSRFCAYVLCMSVMC